MLPSHQDQANQFKDISNELETALKHSQICESHFENGNVPKGCAHAFALEGHLERVLDKLKEVKINHAKMAKV